MIFGYIGANRRIGKVLQAIAEFPAKERFTIDIFGKLFVEAEIRSEIIRLGLTDRVRLHGFVEDEILDRALDSAHLTINLRYPSMGEASGSVLRSWNHALPSLVSRTRWYASLPPEAVKFVTIGNEAWDIRVYLEDFLSNPMHYANMGTVARAILERDHTPSKYIDALRVLYIEVALETNEASRHQLDQTADAI